MDQSFRRATFFKMTENLGIGPLSKLVENSIDGGSTKKELEFKTIGSVGPGTVVFVPPNPVKPDGAIDFFFQIRGIEGSDYKTVGAMGINAVVILCERGGLGSSENRKAFGSAAFVNDAMSKVFANLKSKYPDKNLHRGKLAISSFSGGGSATSAILADAANIQGGAPEAVVFNDSMHSDLNSPEMKAVINYGNQAKDDPSKQLIVLHSAIQTSGYNSTSTTANNLVDKLGLQHQKTNNTDPNWKHNIPYSVATNSNNSVKILQMNEKAEPYYSDPITGQANGKKGSAAQHWSSRKAGLFNMDKLLGDGWK